MGRLARRWNERMLRYLTKDGAESIEVLTNALGAGEHHEEAADTARRAVEALRQVPAGDGKLLGALERAVFWLERTGSLAELPALQHEISELRGRGT